VNLPDTGLRDEASMMLVGVALIGLAGVVRRVV
jgi:LPXTG-motif cell wall-anchored protein